MPNKNFLEEYPLYKRFSFNSSKEYLYLLDRPAIHMKCENCNSEQTFNMVNKHDEHHPTSPKGAIKCNNKVIRLEYMCQSCKNYRRYFLVYFSDNLDYICKVGQYPAWEISIDKNLEKMLGEHAPIFKKGLVCESQGYGIGAFSYYRRITEEIIDELLDSIGELIDKQEKEKYIEALQETKSTRVAQDKIDLVKDLLPKSLRPNGMNPLSVLHSELSEGMHIKPDEDCMENAAHVREILTFLVNQVIRHKESTKQFTESMKKILDKKSGKNK